MSNGVTGVLISTKEVHYVHDLWFPGYLWADTEGKWLVPGFAYHDGMSRYNIQNERLIDAFEQLQQQETSSGQWALGGTSLPFGDDLQERFPLAGRFFDEEGQVAASGLSPDQVAKALEGVFSALWWSATWTPMPRWSKTAGRGTSGSTTMRSVSQSSKSKHGLPSVDSGPRPTRSLRGITGHDRGCLRKKTPTLLHFTLRVFQEHES
jgi:hypothetical protein